jgi:hypothetical protein
MNDEITFLRWAYAKVREYHSKKAFLFFEPELHRQYERETGNKVPNDYRLDNKEGE